MRLFILLIMLAASPLQAQTNHLAGAQSPYLLQHLDNPVDWYPWGNEALNKAHAEQKLIFVSVGYSACHWCHVMEEESFENPEIAAFLNQHFVSIKIDREERPDLDEQFLLVTQLAVGAGGWPNSAFLTPDGKPFYGDTYLPPDIFRAVLEQMIELWRQAPEVIGGEAFKMASQLDALVVRQSKRITLPDDYNQRAAYTFLEGMDSFDGGYGGAPKFPQETLFLFLMDQAERLGDRKVLSAVTGLLDGMIKGGIHDHVGGGFHRYSVDPQWHIPHFEKMLYTQAQTGRLLIRAYNATGSAHYKRAALRLFDFVLTDMRAPSGGFYTALDADSSALSGESIEGIFYTFTPDDLEFLGTDANQIEDIFQVDSTGELDGQNVLNLLELPDPSEYAHLDILLKKMQTQRALRPSPFTDKKILLGWNAAMIETLAEASFLLGRSDVFQAAKDAADFALSSLSHETGMYRVSFSGKAGTDAQLSDYAGFGLALIALHDFDPDKTQRNKWLKAATKMADFIRRDFGTPETGYSATSEPTLITAMIPIDDNELPAGNAQTLALFARIAARVHAPDIAADALSLASTLSGLAADAPETRAAALSAIEDTLSGETGPIRYAAQGNVRITFQKTESGARIDLEVASGWHINSATPLEDYFIPTSLSTNSGVLGNLAIPPAIIKSLGFNKQPLSLLEGHIILRADITPDANSAPPVLKLEFQTCSDEICLQPESLTFTRW